MAESSKDHTHIKKIETLAQAKNIIQFFKNRWEKKEGIRWGIREGDDLVGTIGFQNFGEEAIEIGYELNSGFWGQGIMKEALNIVLDYAFKTMNVSVVIGKVDIKNLNSMNSLLKVGFSSVNSINELITEDFHLILETYSLSSNQYLNSKISNS